MQRQEESCGVTSHIWKSIVLSAGKERDKKCSSLPKLSLEGHGQSPEG